MQSGNRRGSFRYERGDDIGRLLILEFNDNEADIFEKVMEVVERHPDFKKYELRTEPALEIYPDRRKIFRGQKEVSLTAKEFDILCFLVSNCGRVMTYSQNYERVWGDYGQDINFFNTCNKRFLHEKIF